MTAHRRGYVLLMTLGLLVLASSLLVAIARTAVRHVADAALETRRVQRRWAIDSVRAATLAHCERILAAREQAEGRSISRVTANMRLGGMTLTVTVADEQAKTNVNELLRREPPGEVEDRLRRTLPDATAKVHVRVRPAPAELTRSPPGAADTAAAAMLPPVSGFGQVFDDVSPSVLYPPRGASPLDTLTVWGDGGLNLLRADRAAMRIALTPDLTTLQIDRLLAERDTPRPGRTAFADAASLSIDPVAYLLTRAGLGSVNRARLPLVGRSTCHSVSIRLNDGRRVWYDLAVLDASDPRRPRRYSVSD